MTKINIEIVDDSTHRNPFRRTETFEVEDNFSELYIKETVQGVIKGEKQTDDYNDNTVFEAIGRLEGFYLQESNRLFTFNY